MLNRIQIVSGGNCISLINFFLIKKLFLVSNPPPSPVTDSNRENSSDFDTNDIQHVVNVTSPDKTMTMIRNNTSFVDDSRQKNIDNQQHNNGYEDDFLDVHCDDMDLF